MAAGVQKMARNKGDEFQQETKYVPDKMSGGGLNWANQPEVYKQYAGKASIKLPSLTHMETLSLDQALKRRRSVRSFSARPVSKEQLAYLLWASTGIQRVEFGYEFRTAPSAGALYPIETYLAVRNAEEVTPGIYHYSIRSHALEQLQIGDFSRNIAIAALGQRMFVEAAVTFIWTAIFQRSKWEYRERAYRYIYVDAGHIAQNLALAAVSIGLGSCQVGAIYDDEVNEVIGVDGIQESALYLSAVGWPG